MCQGEVEYNLSSYGEPLVSDNPSDPSVHILRDEIIRPSASVTTVVRDCSRVLPVTFSWVINREVGRFLGDRVSVLSLVDRLARVGMHSSYRAPKELQNTFDEILDLLTNQQRRMVYDIMGRPFKPQPLCSVGKVRNMTKPELAKIRGVGQVGAKILWESFITDGSRAY